MAPPDMPTASTDDYELSTMRPLLAQKFPFTAKYNDQQLIEFWNDLCPILGGLEAAAGRPKTKKEKRKIDNIQRKHPGMINSGLFEMYDA